MGLLTNLIEKHVENKHADDQQKQANLRQFYYDRINDPQTDPGIRDTLTDNYLKLLSPDAKKQAQGHLNFLGRLKSLFQAGPQQPQQQAVQPQQPQAPIPAPTAPPAAQQQPPLDDTQEDVNPNPRQQAVQALRAGPQQTATPPSGIVRPFQNYGVAAQQRQQDRLTQLGKDSGLNPRELGIFVASGGKTLPPEKTVTVKNTARPGNDPETGKPYEGLWDRTNGPDGEVWAKRPDDDKSRPTVLSSDVVTIDHARQLAQGGVKYHDADGNELDISKVPDGMVLQAIRRGKNTFYAPRDINQRVIKTGGRTYAVSPLEIGNLPNGAGVDLGASNAPSSSVRGAPAVDPATGQVTINEIASSRTPSAPGIPGRGSAAAPAPSTSAPIPAPSSASRGSSQQTSAAASPTAAPAPGVIGGSTIRGMPSNMFNAAKQQALTVREAATQIHGDPENPEMKGLTSYKDLADDPKSSAKIGKALGIILQGMNDAPDTAHISGHLGPVSASTGGIGALITNALGVPQKLAQQKADIIRNTVGTLTDREAEALNATVSALSTIISLRSLTKAPATQLSMAAIERELPMIGINVKDSKQFDDKIKRVSEVMLNGARGVPENIIGSKLMERVRGKQEPVKAPPAKKGAADKPKTLGAMSHKELFDALAASK